MPGPERRLAAILSADIAGYTRLIAEDEDETIRLLRARRQQVGLLLEQHRGRLVDFTGDNFLAEFPTATGAVECAVEIQRVIGSRNAGLPDDRRMDFRIGIHLGEVRAEEGRVYGSGVNVAARLEALAEPGAICISAAVREQVLGKLSLGLRDLGKRAHTLRNKVILKLKQLGSLDEAALRARIEAHTGAKVAKIRKGPLGILQITFAPAEPARDARAHAMLFSELGDSGRVRRDADDRREHAPQSSQLESRGFRARRVTSAQLLRLEAFGGARKAKHVLG